MTNEEKAAILKLWHSGDPRMRAEAMTLVRGFDPSANSRSRVAALLSTWEDEVRRGDAGPHQADDAAIAEAVEDASTFSDFDAGFLRLLGELPGGRINRVEEGRVNKVAAFLTLYAELLHMDVNIHALLPGILAAMDTLAITDAQEQPICSLIPKAVENSRAAIMQSSVVRDLMKLLR